MLPIIDDFSRECMAAIAAKSILGDRMAWQLDRIARIRGYPCLVMNDNETELTSYAILTW